MRFGKRDRHPMTGNRDVAEEAAGVHGFERHTYDVVVIGAGGAGLRAAIAAHEAGRGPPSSASRCSARPTR